MINSGKAMGEVRLVSGARRRANLPTMILLITLFVSGMLYYAVFAPVRFGAYHDDGIYATTAKALATGQGYRIISLPDEPAQTKYPPLYPLLLSLIWRAWPEFPGNVAWMMLLSAAATVTFLFLTYRYLTRRGYASPWQALIIVALTGINWRTSILATGLYSEMPYAALSVVALYMAERDGDREGGWSRGVASGTAAGLAFLTRSSGLVLLIAIVVYYALLKRWGRAMAAAGVGGTFVLGWLVWCYANKTSAEGVNVAYYTSYLGHLNEVVSDLQRQSNSSRAAVYLGILFTNFVGGILISVPLVCSGMNYSWMPSFSGSLFITICSLVIVLVALAAGFFRHASERLRLLHVYVISCFALYLFWLPGVAYDRFIMPILPFLLLFVVSEFDVLFSLARKGLTLNSPVLKKIVAGFILLVLLAAVSNIFYNYGAGLYRSSGLLKKSVDRAAEDAQAIAWINAHAEPSDVLVCYRDPLYSLSTGRKATRSLPMKEGISWQEDPASMDNLAGYIFQIISEARGRYLVLTSTDFELEDQPEQRRKTFKLLINQYPVKFTPVFEGEDGRSSIYRIEKNER
jgi:hypothetical protein